LGSRWEGSGHPNVRMPQNEFEHHSTSKSQIHFVAFVWVSRTIPSRTQKFPKNILKFSKNIVGCSYLISGFNRVYNEIVESIMKLVAKETAAAALTSLRDRRELEPRYYVSTLINPP